MHPQSIVHSMVQFRDGTVMAQLGCTNMRLPIQYALTYPVRETSAFQRLDFWNMKDLTFEKPDTDTFRGLALAYEAGRMGGTMPCVMNAANEVAVQAFIDGRTGFFGIVETVEAVLENHVGISRPTLEDYISMDQWARRAAEEYLDKAVKK